jgi:hypothetical protein
MTTSKMPGAAESFCHARVPLMAVIGKNPTPKIADWLHYWTLAFGLENGRNCIE